MILENQDKKTRAEEIIAFITGKKIPVSEGEFDRKAHFESILTNEGVDPKGKDAIQFVYEKLGGRVISEAEAKEIAKNKTEIKAKKRKIVE